MFFLDQLRRCSGRVAEEHLGDARKRHPGVTASRSMSRCVRYLCQAKVRLLDPDRRAVLRSIARCGRLRRSRCGNRTSCRLWPAATAPACVWRPLHLNTECVRHMTASLDSLNVGMRSPGGRRCPTVWSFSDPLGSGSCSLSFQNTKTTHPLRSRVVGPVRPLKGPARSDPLHRLQGSGRDGTNRQDLPAFLTATLSRQLYHGWVQASVASNHRPAS
jgi:hypothetical protein